MSLVRNAACLLAAVWMALTLPSRGEEERKETIVYKGPVFTSPADTPGQDLKFVREFTVDSGLWQRQFTMTTDSLGEPVPLSAEKAIELARASGEQGFSGAQKNVTKLELLTLERESPKGSRARVPFYLIEMNISGSEVQRIVLMDGTVIKPSLRQVTKP